MLEIRKITEAQAEEVAALEAAVFSDPWSRESVIGTIRQPHARLTGVWEEEELAGYIAWYYVLDECEIARIAVKERFRRKGAAGKLLEENVKFCRDHAIIKLMLDVRQNNIPAITFYKKYGFEQDGIRKRFYTNPTEDAILMSRKI